MSANTISANTRIVGAARSGLGLQKAFLAIILVVLVMAVANLFPATRSNFFTEANFINVLKSASIFIILAMGETIVLIAGGVDLSIGGMMAFSGVVVILLMNAGVPIPIAIALALLVGVGIGAINALISVYQRAEPFIITLGMGIVLTGAGQQLTNARPVSSKVPAFADIANFKILGPIPLLVVVMIAVVAVTYWLLRNTSFGRNVYAIGGDNEVAKYSGINVRRTKAATYLICGLLAALGGVMLASQLNSASSIAGEDTALYVVCAVVVGGTSVAGGVGGAIKSLIGLLLLGLLTNSFNMLRVDSYVAYLPTALLGIIIVSILWLDSYTRKRRREAV
jgi:ribose/xylose/arabinose/galactoside ABC-type transport system permease subunit